MKTIIVHVLSTEQEKIDNAFDYVREALTDKGVDIMLFESETLREAAEILADQASKREPKKEELKKEVNHSAFGHLYDDAMGW